jgi:hypothetical protein
MFPTVSVATHSDGDGHDTARIGAPTGSRLTDRHVEGPANGSVELSRSPLWSTAAQSDAPAQAMPSIKLAGGPPIDQVGLLVPGFVEVKMWPVWSPATHRVAKGQTIRTSTCPGSMLLSFQASPPAAGSVLVNALPSSSTATHIDGDPHDTAVRRYPVATPGASDAGASRNGADHVNGCISVAIAPADNVSATTMDTDSESHRRRLRVPCCLRGASRSRNPSSTLPSPLPTGR